MSKSITVFNDLLNATKGMSCPRETRWTKIVPETFSNISKRLTHVISQTCFSEVFYELMSFFEQQHFSSLTQFW